MDPNPTPDWIPCDGENDWQGECRWCKLLFPDGSESEGSYEEDPDQDNPDWLKNFRWRYPQDEDEGVVYNWTTYDPQPTHFQLFPEE